MRAVEEGMELIARGDTWAAARAELDGVTGVLASDGGKELVGGEVAALCVKAEEGGGAGGGKDAEVLGRGEKIDAGEIGAVEQEAHMAAAHPGGGGWDTERRESSETRGRRKRAYER